MPMQSDVSEEGQIVQSSGEQSELTENGQTDQPSGNQSGSMENGQTGQPSGDQSGSMENGQTDQPSGDQSGSAENGQAVQPSGDQSGSAENGQTDPSSDQQSEDADLYENGIIKIYNIEQLQAIGTGSSVRMNDTEKELFGTGEEVVDGGNAVTYASDADYMLMNEIPLTAKTMWTLPEGFTGTFAEAPKEDAPLYDKESDTVYVYNNYQLLLIASENSAEEPIMSYDMIPEKVGIGQLLYKDGTLADESAEAAQEYLTYSKEHNYVLSPSFTEQMPELKAEKIKKEATVQADAGQLGGREYLGQVYTKVEGEPYILIGNEWQLRAIGQDAKPKEKGNQYMQVTPMLYVKSIVDLPWPWDDKITYTPYYPGDADFNLKQGEALGESGIEQKDFIYFSEANTNKTEGLMNIEYDKEGLVGFLLGPLGELLGDILHALLGPLFDIPILGDLLAGLIGERTDDIVIVDKEFNQNNVQSYPSLSEASNELKSLKYSPDANYIIFRDIDLLQGEYSDGKEDDWTPLHFSGKMEGRLNMQEGSVPTISSLASLVQSFIPIIEDSQTSSVPCGGAVRADGITDTQCVRGLAGGYVGYNHGGRIKGYAAEGGGKECATIRIRSVYGGEFAGGFTGLMETADLAGTGNLQLLFGLLKTSNVLSLLGAVYPTETNTAVYGPLRKVDMDTWNKWAEAVGNNGVYGDQFTSTPVENEEQLQALITQYAYGYNVKAGRTSVGTQDMEAGVAGGYVGRMKAGVVTNAHAWDAKSVMAYKSAGGFAGEMKTGGVAEVGKVELIGLDIANSISAVQTFVPIIRNSDITGFQSGMTVKATGIPVKDSTLKIEKVGYAGGYVGHMVGGQIWGNWSEKANTYSATDAVPDPNNKRCFVANLRKVEGTKAIGGFAGQIDPASAANLDTASSEGLLGGLLQYLIGTPGDLARLLDATISTVRGADVKAWDDWGIIVNGSYTNDSDHTAYAKAAGGFAGEINGAVIGKQDDPNSGLHVVNIRSVTGGEYAGGFLGLADVSAILQVSNGNTSILSALLTLGGTSVLDTFRSYVYHSDVSGSAEAGLEVQARDSKKSEYVNDPVYSGSAGGFGGALLNGSVKDSKVTNLRKVNGMNYTGGFIGHLGKSGTVDLDNLGALGDLLSAGAGVMDVFGSHVDRCSVEGVNEGFTVHSNNTIDQKNKSEIAGGFTGYADLGRLSENKVTGLKQVTSGQIAGGFAGKTTFAYLANINLDSELVKGLVTVVNQILKALWLDELQKGQVIKIDLGIIEIDALYDGKLVSLNLLGLDIKVGLAEDKSLATIYIGDSKIEINCSESGTIDEESLKNEINISLIKANRTKIDKCTVTGIADGYDVYGGGAGNNANGTGQYGIAGGFVGWNNEGLLENNNMFFADVIRGAKDLTGPFTGKSSLNSNWEFNDVKGIEGNENYYRIYRNGDTAYEKLFGKSGKELQHNYETSDAWKNVYTIRHMTKDKVVKFTDLKDAMMSGSAGQIPVNVYQEDGAMAVLMNNTASSPTEPGGNEEAPDVQDPCKDLIELRLKKVWKRDEEKDRPNEVIFNITRSYEKDGKPVVDTNFNKEVILTKKDAQTSDIWEKVLTGAEYTAYHVGTDGKKYYYTYHVSEMKVDGYTTEITYKGDRQYSITVTNTKNWFDSLLPETGGMGKALLYTLGVLLLCLVTATEYRKRKSTRSQSSYK